MSDLIDRYLAAIARELPERQRADITAELRDELMSRIEGEEDRLGRPLTRTELEATLRDFGNPLVVAGRFRKTQHLIGPQILPFWWQAIKVTMTVIAANDPPATTSMSVQKTSQPFTSSASARAATRRRGRTAPGRTQRSP